MTASIKATVATSIIWVLRFTFLNSAVIGLPLLATAQTAHDHAAPAKLVQIVRQATQQFIDVNAAESA